MLKICLAEKYVISGILKYKYNVFMRRLSKQTLRKHSLNSLIVIQLRNKGAMHLSVVLIGA